MGATQGTTEMLGGRYRLDHLLGRGGMGAVWAGYDTILNRPVAVKMLRDDLGTDAEVQRERLRAEARAAASVRHPNLAATFDAVAHDGTLAIVMERLPGPSLAQRLDSGPLAAHEVRAVGLDVLAALHAVHEAGLVHRDVKPANVLRTADDRWKLVDFGIAKNLLAEHDLTQTGTTIGTPAYLAPEQLRGEATTPGADLWAVGVMLYQALTGALPFAGDTPYAIAHAVQVAEPEPLSNLLPDADPGLVELVERALSKDPDDRFESAITMAAALVPRPAAPAAPPASPRLAFVDPALSVGSLEPAKAEEPIDLVDLAVDEEPHPAPNRRRAVALVAASLVLAVVAAVTLGIGADDDGTGRLDEPAGAEDGGGPSVSGTPAAPVDAGNGTSTQADPSTGGSGRSGRSRSTSGSTNEAEATDGSTTLPPADGSPTEPTGTNEPAPGTEPGDPTPVTTAPPDTTDPPDTTPPSTSPPTTEPTTTPTTSTPTPPITLPELPIPLPDGLDDLLPLL